MLRQDIRDALNDSTKHQLDVTAFVRNDMYSVSPAELADLEDLDLDDYRMVNLSFVGQDNTRANSARQKSLDMVAEMALAQYCDYVCLVKDEFAGYANNEYLWLVSGIGLVDMEEFAEHIEERLAE